jgi:hypothetical protein
MSALMETDVIRELRHALVVLAAAFTFSAAVAQPPAGAPQPAQSPRAAAPIDLTGWWVSVVTEDWRWRMVTPVRGDFANIPLAPAAYAVAGAWDPAKDEAAGESCKAYGAPAIMRRPGRLHITWADDETLRIDTDEGTQTRLLHFGTTPPSNELPSLQGWSSARWEPPLRGTAPPDPFSIGTQPRAGAQGRALEVATSHLRPGYLRANGIPFSDKVELTEYFNTFREPNGTEWFVVTTIVRDPVYLAGPFVTTSNFKREPNGAKFKPSACRAR